MAPVKEKPVREHCEQTNRLEAWRGSSGQPGRRVRDTQPAFRPRFPGAGAAIPAEEDFQSEDRADQLRFGSRLLFSLLRGIDISTSAESPGGCAGGSAT